MKLLALALALFVVAPCPCTMTALPLGRPRTYGSNTPLVPQDLDDIFDSIIGGKHGAIDIPYGPQQFFRDDGSGQLLAVQAQQWSFNGATSAWLAADLRLPVGTMINTITFGYDRQAKTIDVGLVRRAFPGGAQTTVVPSAGTVTDTTSSGPHSNIITYGHITEAGYIYEMLATITTASGAPLLYGSIVNCHRP